MNALNEVNKLIMNLNTIQRSTSTRSDEPESLTGEKLIVTLLIKFDFMFVFLHFVCLAMDRRESCFRHCSS